MSFQFLTGGRLTQVLHLPPNLKTLATPMASGSQSPVPCVSEHVSSVLQSSLNIAYSAEHQCQARIQDFCQGRAPRDWWPYMGWRWTIFTYANTDLQLFNRFIAILCLNDVEQPFKGHQCPFSALETKEPEPSARVPPSQGWAPDLAPPPPLDPRLSAVCFAKQIDWPVLLCPADHASQLMQKVFDVAIATNLSTASYISDTMALLSMQTGAWWPPPPVSSHRFSGNFVRVKYIADDETSVSSRTPRFCVYSALSLSGMKCSLPLCYPFNQSKLQCSVDMVPSPSCADVVVCPARYEHTGITSSLYYTANDITTSSTHAQLQLRILTRSDRS